jgi:hypothetical protein
MQWSRIQKQHYGLTRDLTWADIKACAADLSNAEVEFAPLHRVEGGFMCVREPGFETNERVDSASQPTKERSAVPVRKAVRFSWSAGKNHSWPSWNNSFLGDPNLKDDSVVVPHSLALFRLEFEGQNTDQWTTACCDRLASVVSASLHALPISSKAAGKLKRGALRRRGISK